jgi:hypothetical protein
MEMGSVEPQPGTTAGAYAGLLLALLAPHPAVGQAPAPPVPGPEHEVLTALAGSWDVYVDGQSAGQATATTKLGGRYVEVDIRASAGPLEHAVYTLGFDRRHGRYTVIAMDDAGTYWVSGTGARDGQEIAMYGTDDDPRMAAMGLEKAFVIVLHLFGDDHAGIETRFIDTRTDERREMSFHTFELRRVR